ncbi:MAG: hypothetical protein HRU12_24410, partial [Phaeodactylibacter sp.]|nr:hypothetical protein [Phaeodactylibacter sp.]
MKMDIGSLITPFFFAIVLVLGLQIVEDYGLSYDEPIQREYGLSVIEYIGKKLPFYNPTVDAYP